jgi:hypothetical protein
MANYILLERIELNASAASVTFANIPQSGYTDLKIVVSARSDSTTGNFFEIRPNGATTNLSGRYLQGDGSAVNSSTFQPWAYVPPSNATASTFGSVDIYIPNYSLTSVNKSISVDYVTENNATTAYAGIEAGLWSSTSAITSLVFAMSTGNFVQYSTFSLYGLAALGTTPTIAPKASGGNIIDYDGTYWIHTFLTTGTFTPQQGLTCDYLVVAGGGGGGGSTAGSNNGGGAGAGGLRSTVTATGGGGSLESALSVTTGTNYTVTVGAGGAGGVLAVGTVGSNSVFSTVTSNGGGFGGRSLAAGGNGGSGGGGSTAGTGTANQGRAGGLWANAVSNYGNGGGGGANTAGANGTGSTGGAGGAGVSVSITGSSVTYAGGGGGGTSLGGTAGAGGSGGGGAGGSNAQAGTAGTANLGGGGGGAGTNDVTSFVGGNGGSGIVIIRYLA